ncbi:MAG: thiol-disulfide oxidoreductase DCC family protein [Eudoraea sp.]|nr:thiol-disulfide oxidoreductase DCC family protein [Eudoraea sp.]
MKHNKQIILFDGVCNLCNRFVQWIIKRDKNDAFRFAPLESKIGQQLLQEHNLNPDAMDTIVLIQPFSGHYTKSTAALKIGSTIGGIYRIFSLFWIFPAFLRDPVYDWVARNRYKWYGKQDKCMVPTAELKAKFLE